MLRIARYKTLPDRILVRTDFLRTTGMPWRQAQMFPFRFYLPKGGPKLDDDLPLEQRDQTYLLAVLQHIRTLVCR